jgi:hypothetical protein
MRDDLKKLLGTCCLPAAVVLSSLAAAQQPQEPMGRLFFTPAQRTSLDIARSQRARTTLATERTEEQAAPIAQSITYGGMVRRSDGKNTVWLNNQPVHDREPVGGAAIVGQVRTDGSVTLQNPQSGRSVELKPGQSVELLSGAIEEGYLRKPIPPETKPPAKGAINDKKGAKPAPEELARVERERERREQERLEDALRAIQDAGTLKPAAQPTPTTEVPAAKGPAR